MRVGFTWILAATKTYSFSFPADLKGVCDLNFFIMGPVKPKTGKTPFIHYYSVLLLQSQHFSAQTPKKAFVVLCQVFLAQKPTLSTSLDPELSEMISETQVRLRLGKKPTCASDSLCRLYSTSSALLIWDRIKEGNKIRASKPQSH